MSDPSSASPSEYSKHRRINWALGLYLGALGLFVLWFLRDEFGHIAKFALLVGLTLGPVVTFWVLMHNCAPRGRWFGQTLFWGCLVFLYAGFQLKHAVIGALAVAQPGAFLERSAYKARVLIDAQLADQEQITFRVPAQIEAHWIDDSFETADGRTQEASHRAYQLYSMELPDGSSAVFAVENRTLYWGRRNDVWDNTGRKWRVRLTSELAP